jgi:hypothetical protein
MNLSDLVLLKGNLRRFDFTTAAYERVRGLPGQEAERVAAILAVTCRRAIGGIFAMVTADHIDQAQAILDSLDATTTLVYDGDVSNDGDRIMILSGPNGDEQLSRTMPAGQYRLIVRRGEPE